MSAAVAKFLFILMVHGSGSSFSTPLPVATYPSMPACEAARDYLQKAQTSWATWFCASVPLPEGAIPLIGKAN